MNKNNLLAMAMMLGAAAGAGYDSLYSDEPLKPVGPHKPYNRDGKKCGTCAYFGKRECPCSKAKEASPCCSKYSVY